MACGVHSLDVVKHASLMSGVQSMSLKLRYWNGSVIAGFNQFQLSAPEEKIKKDRTSKNDEAKKKKVKNKKASMLSPLLNFSSIVFSERMY